MKHFLLRISIPAILIVSCCNVFSVDNRSIYLENRYGATIKYKLGNSQSTSPEIAVPSGDRVLIGAITNVNNISIRTTGTGSRIISLFTELTTQIKQINSDKSELKNLKKNAIITINPSSSYQNWNITIDWKSPEDEAIIELPAELNAQYEIAALIDGSLGPDYAEKVRAIDSYDYTKSTKGGFINLRNSLIKSIENVNKQTYKRTPGKKTPFIAPDPSTINDLKATINTLYNALQKYRVRDSQ